jgi:hypothetical protein
VPDPENPPPTEELGSKILAALHRIEGRLEGMEVRLNRLEEEVLAACNRSFRPTGSFGGLTQTQRAAEEEWKRVEGTAQHALERQRQTNGSRAEHRGSDAQDR